MSTFPDLRPLRILVIRYRFVGDTVLAIPFLRNLRRAFPHAIIDVLVEPVSGDTLLHCPYKNELLYFAPRLRGAARARSKHPTRVLSCALMLRKRGYDRAYVLRRSHASVLLPWLARIPHRVGFALSGRTPFLHRSIEYGRKHEVECFLDVLRADGIPVTDSHNENWSDPEIDRQVASALLPSGRRRVFVCPKSAYAPKEWTAERFASVLAWLIQEQSCDIHFCDSPGNVPYYRTMVAALPPSLRSACTDWSEKLGVSSLNSLFRHIDLVVGIDTGLMHVAASFHIPVFVLFGSNEPWRWYPWDTCHFLLQPSSPTGPQPLLQISADDAKRALADQIVRLLPVP